LAVLFMLALAACGGTTGAGGEWRSGRTEVPPTLMYSLEQYHNEGAFDSGDGWHILWLQGDEFAYCMDQTRGPGWIKTFEDARKAGQPVVVFYYDGGNTTGACHVGVAGTYKVRVVGLEVLTAETDLRPRALPENW
jgi:hypothetical protein